MKILKSTVEKILITGIDHHDPISVYLEDIREGHGKLTITCWDDAWTNYWCAMGTESIKEFILSTNNDYLISKLATGLDHKIDDPDKLVEACKKEIFKRRREKDISDKAARELYDNLYWEDGEELINNHDLMYDIFGDEWWYRIPKKSNPDYEHLSNILNIVKDALRCQ